MCDLGRKDWGAVVLGGRTLVCPDAFVPGGFSLTDYMYVTSNIITSIVVSDVIGKTVCEFLEGFRKYF